MKKLLIIVPLLCVLLLGGAIWWRYGRVRSPYTVAQQLMDKGDYTGAQLELRAAVRLDPRNTAAHYRLGDMDLRLGDPVAAEKELKTARDMGFDARTINPLLAQTYMAQGKYRELLAEFPTQGLPPDQAVQIQVMRAMAQLALGDAKAAQASAAEAERMAPQSADPLIASARIAVAQHDFATAVQKVKLALQTNPRSTDALLLQGQLENLQGDRVRALASFDATLALNPKMLTARLERANILLASNQDARAKEDIDAALKIEPRSAMAIFLSGVLATKDADYQTADAAFTKISSLLSRLPRGFYYQAIAKYNLGEDEQATEAAEHYIAHNPNDPDGIKLYAKIELAAQRSATVIKVLAPAVDAGSTDSEMLDLLGRAYLMAGQNEEAMEVLQRAAALAPNDAGILMRLAAARMTLGDSVQATGELEHALQLAPTQAGAAEALVIAAISSGAIDKAALALDQLRKVQGDSETVGNLAALIQMAQLDLNGAQATLEGVIKHYPDAIQPRVNLAKVLVLQDKPADAEKVLTEILARQPANSAALNNMVSLLLGDGQVARAVSLIEAAHTASPKDIGVMVGLANLYVRTGNAGKALDLLNQGLKAQQGNATLLTAKAQTQQALGQAADARATYRQILAMNPTDVTTRRTLAGLLAANKDLDAAKAVLADGLRRQPGNSELMEAYVTTLLRAGGIDAALAGADQLAQNAANLPGARLLRGDVYLAAGRYGDAATAYAAELQANPATTTLLRLASALNADGRTEQASQVLRDWLVNNPSDVGAADALASLDIAAHRFFDAEAHLQIVLDRQPTNAAALNDLAWVYQQRADARAQPTAQKAYLISPTPQAADTLGWILTTSGQAAKAVTLLRQASAQLPGDPTVQYHLAVALNDTGQRDEALKVVQPAAQGLLNFDDKAAAQQLMANLLKNK
jgi:putative PEP-CTERM system TPR-repeat lipoprotein